VVSHRSCIDADQSVSGEGHGFILFMNLSTGKANSKARYAQSSSRLLYGASQHAMYHWECDPMLPEKDKNSFSNSSQLFLRYGLFTCLR